VRLKGRTAIVTGGASGLGLEIARRYAAEGAQVVIADIRGAEEAAISISAGGVSCVGVPADVSSETSVEELVSKCIDSFGTIDILVNNAAIAAGLELKPLEDISVAEWQRMMNINAMGTFLCCRAVSGHMRQHNSGRIINMTSGTAFKGAPFMLPYVASKGAIISMTRSLAKELGEHNILVNAIAPGYTVTENMLKNRAFHESQREIAIAGRALKRESRPEDIVGSAVFLASDDASFITGQIIAVDGGSVYH
jgi:NAD(P)-dependent dehydrogenase (short-subunit alcohol dehydrogenase family)